MIWAWSSPTGEGGTAQPLERKKNGMATTGPGGKKGVWPGPAPIVVKDREGVGRPESSAQEEGEGAYPEYKGGSGHGSAPTWPSGEKGSCFSPMG